MIVEVRPGARGSWLAVSTDAKLRAQGATTEEAIVALKRASLMQLAKARKENGDVDTMIEWDVVPRRGRVKSQRHGVELSADIHIAETKAGGTWKWRSDGGAVSGSSPSLDRARDDAARASWRALASNLDDEDVARAGAMRIAFEVTTTSEWVVDHLASDRMGGRGSFRASFTALKRALGAPHLDPFDGEPLYGWGLSGKKGRAAWLGARIRDAEDDVTEKQAASFAKRLDEFELAATDERALQSVAKWLRERTAAKDK